MVGNEPTRAQYSDAHRQQICNKYKFQYSTAFYREYNTSTEALNERAPPHCFPTN
uniref:Uncharacterized protein n=1 Tax=Anguilla anguilla TaxID=7936 RepID=A0A0E9RBN0_ANGAN